MNRRQLFTLAGAAAIAPALPAPAARKTVKTVTIAFGKAGQIYAYPADVVLDLGATARLANGIMHPVPPAER